MAAWELVGVADEDAPSDTCALEVVEEVYVFHAGLGLPFFAKCGRRAGDDACDFESTEQGHSRAGDIDEHEITRTDLGADAAKFDGFGASEDEIRILGLYGH